MASGIVYYCWSCDGHCRAIVNIDQSANCPRCGKLLTEDCRVSHSSSKPGAVKHAEASLTTLYASRPFAAAS